MKACDLRVSPDMTVEELIPFLQGIVYAEKFYADEVNNKSVQFEVIEQKEEE